MSDTTLKKCPIPGCGSANLLHKHADADESRPDLVVCQTCGVELGLDDWQALPRPSAELGIIAGRMKSTAASWIKNRFTLPKGAHRQSMVVKAGVLDRFADEIQSLAAPETQGPTMPPGTWVVHHRDYPPLLFDAEAEARPAQRERADTHVVTFYGPRPEQQQPNETVADVVREMKKVEPVRSSDQVNRNPDTIVVKYKVWRGWLNRLSSASVGPAEVWAVMTQYDHNREEEPIVYATKDEAYKGHWPSGVKSLTTSDPVKCLVHGAQPKQDDDCDNCEHAERYERACKERDELRRKLEAAEAELDAAVTFRKSRERELGNVIAEQDRKIETLKQQIGDVMVHVYGHCECPNPRYCLDTISGPLVGATPSSHPSEDCKYSAKNKGACTSEKCKGCETYCGIEPQPESTGQASRHICTTCLRPRVTDEETSMYAPGEGEHLCWARDDDFCNNEPSDSGELPVCPDCGERPTGDILDSTNDVLAHTCDGSIWRGNRDQWLRRVAERTVCVKCGGLPLLATNGVTLFHQCSPRGKYQIGIYPAEWLKRNKVKDDERQIRPDSADSDVSRGMGNGVPMRDAVVAPALERAMEAADSGRRTCTGRDFEGAVIHFMEAVLEYLGGVEWKVSELHFAATLDGERLDAMETRLDAADRRRDTVASSIEGLLMKPTTPWFDELLPYIRGLLALVGVDVVNLGGDPA